MTSYNSKLYLSMNNNNHYKIRSNNKSECEEIFEILKKLHNPIDLTTLDQYEEVVLKPLNYLKEKPFVDPKIIVSNLNYWLKLPHDKLKIIEDVFEMLMDISFVLTDITDYKMIRRDRASVHVVHGIPSTVASCNYAHFKILEKLVELDHPDAITYYIQAGKIHHQGQALDIYWREISKCPTLSEYLTLTQAKSSNYLLMVYKIMKLFSTTGHNLQDFVNLFGVFNQYRNDYKNLFNPTDENLNISFNEVLADGRFTFPLIHAIHSLNNDDVYDIIKSKPKSVETKQKCLTILKEIGTQKHCLNVLKALRTKLHGDAKKIGHNPYMEMALDHLMDF